jgi:hypothetical protein
MCMLRSAAEVRHLPIIAACGCSCLALHPRTAVARMCRILHTQPAAHLAVPAAPPPSHRIAGLPELVQGHDCCVCHHHGQRSAVRLPRAQLRPLATVDRGLQQGEAALQACCGWLLLFTRCAGSSNKPCSEACSRGDRGAMFALHVCVCALAQSASGCSSCSTDSILCNQYCATRVFCVTSTYPAGSTATSVLPLSCTAVSFHLSCSCACFSLTSCSPVCLLAFGLLLCCVNHPFASSPGLPAVL